MQQTGHIETMLVLCWLTQCFNAGPLSVMLSQPLTNIEH